MDDRTYRVIVEEHDLHPMDIMQHSGDIVAHRCNEHHFARAFPFSTYYEKIKDHRNFASETFSADSPNQRAIHNFPRLSRVISQPGPNSTMSPSKTGLGFQEISV